MDWIGCCALLKCSFVVVVVECVELFVQFFMMYDCTMIYFCTLYICISDIVYEIYYH